MKHHGFSFIMGVMLASALTGCSMGGQALEPSAQPAASTMSDSDSELNISLPDESDQAPQSAENQADPNAPAFHFASGDLVLGDFDYDEIKDDLFNPCEEISAEEFAEVGLEKIEEGVPLAVGGVGCGMINSARDKAVAIGTTFASREQLLSRPELEAQASVSSVIPDLMFYKGAQQDVVSCVAAVDTERGEFSIAAAQLLNDDSFEELCSYARDVMEDLYNKNQ